MTPNRHERLEILFRAASELTQDARRSFLAGLTPEDRAEIESLLAFDQPDDRLPVEGPSAQVASLLVDTLAPRRHPVQIGTFAIKDVLGEGGMAIVYRAQQESPQRIVALKVIRPGWLDESLERRFAYEISVLGRLQHPGIARIYDAGTADTGFGLQPYFAMELIEGEPLLVAAKQRRLSVRQKVELVAKVCDAVHHAHQKGVIHRDLKPSNILVDASGEPRILDFGVAKAIDADLQLTTMHTRAGQLVGTVGYMSPEQMAEDSQDLDSRSDVYALGVILFELLTDQLPHAVRNKTIHEAIRAIREDDPIPLGRLAPGLRGDLEIILSKALEKERERRYQSASALADDLRRFVEHRPIVARPPTAWYQLAKFARRHRALVGGITTTFVVLVVGLVVSLLLLRRAHRAEQDAVLHGQEETAAKQRAQANEVRARDAERRALSLSGIPRLDGLITETDDLWPRYPEKIPAMADWLRRARELEAELPTYRADLAALEAMAARVVDGRHEFDDARLQWLDDNIHAMVGKLETFVASDSGTIHDIEARLARANEIEARTIDDYANDWDAAIEDIKNHPKYGGLELQPQIGLVPLERDPESQLWEFWVWESGERPQRDEKTGRWRITGDTGIVLALIPGGTFWMGAQKEDPKKPNYDAQAKESEGPVVVVALVPFFLSKYESTQGQWDRAMPESRSPSFYGSDHPLTQQLSLAHPVEQIPWMAAVTYGMRLGLLLPAEAQWEFAARAGTKTPWWTGDDPGVLATAANLFDRASFATQPAMHSWGEPCPWEDPFPVHSPVGQMRANPFGLHDVLGNVSEWCLDRCGPTYAQAPRDGDGFRDGTTNLRPVRGGAFSKRADSARASSRRFVSEISCVSETGFRLARPIAGQAAH